MGGVDAIKDKIVNFGHQEINRDDIKDNLDNIIVCMHNIQKKILCRYHFSF